MSRMFTIFACVLATALPAFAQTPLEILPEDAAVGIAIRDLDDLMKKGDVFLRDADIRMPIRPSQVFDQGAQFIGIRKGFDRKASAAIVLMSPEKKEDYNGLRILNYIVPILPSTDIDTMADNYGIGKGKLLDKKILRTDRTEMDMLTSRIGRRGKHVYLNDSEKSLRRAIDGPTVASALTADQRKVFDQSDILLHFGSYFFREALRANSPDFIGRFKTTDDPKEQEFAEQFTASLSEVRNIVTGFRLQAGIDSHMIATVGKDGMAEKLLKGLKNQGKPSTLAGLPEGNALFAQASAGSTEKQAMLTKAMFSLLLEEMLIRDRFIHHVDRLAYLGVFQEVLRHVQGNRLAVYQNAAEKKHGLFCTIAILDVEDAKIFVAGMRILAKMATADTLDLTKKEVKEELDLERLVRELGSTFYPVRQSATTKLTLVGEPALPYLAKAIESKEFDLEGKRRARDLRDRIHAVAAQRRKELLDERSRPVFDRPKLTFVANVEKRQGVSVDIIDIKLAGMDAVRTQRFTQMFGPDWDKVRLGIVGNQIVFMLGSDTALFEAALANLKKGDAGLAGSKKLSGFHEIAAKERQFEFHVSVEGVLRLINPNAAVDRPAQMTSTSLTIGDRWLRVDARVPMPEVRTIAQRAQEEFK
ncbi:MAG: hypothetical protein HYR84_01345 [Planctomycetes bacterium]|nr:hypothetical protein [Planctomycetota bacterium]